MQSISARIDDKTHNQLEDLADDRGSSTSAVVRDLIEKGMEYDDLERENERLREQLRATNSRQDDVDELVRYVEDELSYRDAGLATRAKWWLFGRDRDGSESVES